VLNRFGIESIEKTALVFILFLAILNPGLSRSRPHSTGGDFNTFIESLYSTEESRRQARVDSFINAQRSFPIVEDTIVYFVYTGEGRKVSVPGDFNGWNPSHAPMRHVPGTNFWYRVEGFERDARLDYKFFRDGGMWFLDPLNKLKVQGGFGPNSELRMPLYEPPLEVEYQPDIPHGEIVARAFRSEILGNNREVRLYLPPGYRVGAGPYPLVLVHDGLEYLSLVRMDNVLDYLIAHERVRPPVALFVPTVKRNREYTGGGMKDFARAVVKELLPEISTDFAVSDDPAETVVIGSSAGADISLFLGIRYPERFGNIGILSPYIDKNVRKAYSVSKCTGARIYIVHGSYDHLRVIHSSVRGFLPILRTKGYDYEYHVYHEGHSYGLWRAHIDDILECFLGVAGVDAGNP